MKTFSVATRRTFLRTSLFLGTLVLLRRTDVFISNGRSDAGNWLSSKLANVFYDKESARTIGRKYLRIVPAEADVRRLTYLISSSWNQPADKIAHADARKIKKILLGQQRQDFEKGRTVEIEGWILSETEARLCALSALV